MLLVQTVFYKLLNYIQQMCEDTALIHLAFRMASKKKKNFCVFIDNI